MPFVLDDNWQRNIRDALLAPFYRDHCVDGRYVFMDKGRYSTLIQKRDAVDTLGQFSAGYAKSIEEKIVRYPGYCYTHICLETHSCTVPGHESPGWMEYGQADILNYCRMINPSGEKCEPGNCISWCGQCWLDGDAIHFPKLKIWFEKNRDRLKEFGPVEPPNFTKGRLLSLGELRENIPTKQFQILAKARAA